MPFRADRRVLRAAAHALGAAVLFAAVGAHAQAPGRALEFEDLGLTRREDVSARGASLSASVSTTSDVTALIYNPAGLCRIKQRSPLLGLCRQSSETVTSYGAASSGLSSDRFGLGFVGASAAIPVFQGSLVPAVAVYRTIVSNLDLAYDFANADEGRTDAFRLQQSGATYAFAFGFGIDLASVLSAGLSMSLFEGGYQSLRQSHTRTSAPPTVDRYVIDDIDGDLDGVSARLGVMLYAHSHAHVGVNVTTPTLVNGATHATQEVTEVVQNGTGSTVRTTMDVTTEYIVPYRVDGSIAMPWGDWLLAVEAGTCDWTEAAIDGGRLRLSNGNAVLGRTTDYRVGLEWTAPAWPLRLRAGLARLPFAPEYVQADRIDNDQLEEVLAESAPLRYSFGAGIALKHTILIDAAFTHTEGDRRAASFSEKRRASQIIIEGSYWF